MEDENIVSPIVTLAQLRITHHLAHSHFSNQHCKWIQWRHGARDTFFLCNETIGNSRWKWPCDRNYWNVITDLEREKVASEKQLSMEGGARAHVVSRRALTVDWRLLGRLTAFWLSLLALSRVSAASLVVYQLVTLSTYLSLPFL